MPHSQTRDLVTAALVAALIAVGAWVALPIGPVPVTLQTFAIVLAALVLPPRQAFAAVGVYLLAGAMGVPVFAAGRAGFSVFAGPTGGFLAGFLVAAPLAAWVRVALARRAGGTPADGVAAAVAIGVTYALGWAHLAFVLGLGPTTALAGGVAPFVVADALKCVAAVAVAGALRRASVLARP
jgi:biotin transport system substrate-specific component